MGSSPGHVSGSPGLGGFPGHSWGSLLATLARSAVANSVNTRKGWIIFSLCYPAVGQGWEEQIFPSWDCPRVTHSTSQTRKCSGLSSLGGRGSAPALLSSFAVTKLNLTSDLQTLETHPSAPSLQRDTQEGLSCGGGWTLRAQSTRGLSSGSAVALGKSLHLFASVSSSVK